MVVLLPGQGTGDFNVPVIREGVVVTVGDQEWAFRVRSFDGSLWLRVDEFEPTPVKPFVMTDSSNHTSYAGTCR